MAKIKDGVQKKQLVRIHFKLHRAVSKMQPLTGHAGNVCGSALQAVAAV
jgi:hypothetical protein